MFGLLNYLWERQQFGQNKRMLKGLGIAYDKETHAKYVQAAQKKGLEPVSIPSVIVAKKLDQPVNEKNCDIFTKQWKGYGSWGEFKGDRDTLDFSERDAYSKAQKHMTKYKPLLNAHVACLSDIVSPVRPLAVEYDRNCYEVALNTSHTYGFSENAFLVRQNWKIGAAGTEKLAIAV